MISSLITSLLLVLIMEASTSSSAFLTIHPTLSRTTKATSFQMSFDKENGNFFDEISPEDSDEEDEEGEDDEIYGTLSPTEAYAALSMEEFEEHIPKINTVTLVGRIGQDPEPRYFDDGKVVLRLGLAVKRKYHPLERQARNIRTGEEETDWFNLELWGRDAEYAGKYVTKGARVGVTGSLNMDAWTDRMSGEERTSPKIVVRQLDILETRAEAELRKGGSRGNYSSNYDNDNAKESSGFDYGDGPSSAGSGGFFDN